MATNLESILRQTLQRNVDRYSRLLATDLTQLEREYILRRIEEDRRELEQLSAANNPRA